MSNMKKGLATLSLFVSAFYYSVFISTTFFLNALKELSLLIYIIVPLVTPIFAGYLLLQGKHSRFTVQATIFFTLLPAIGMLVYLLTSGPIPLQLRHKIGGTLIFAVVFFHLYFSKLLLGEHFTLIKHETIVKEETDEQEPKPAEKQPEEPEETEQVEEPQPNEQPEEEQPSEVKEENNA